MTILPVPAAPSPPDIWVMMPSHCPRCVEAGCPRVETVNEPTELRWSRGAALVRCAYACPSCAHRWTDDWPLWGLLGIDADQGE